MLNGTRSGGGGTAVVIILHYYNIRRVARTALFSVHCTASEWNEPVTHSAFQIHTALMVLGKGKASRETPKLSH